MTTDYPYHLPEKRIERYQTLCEKTKIPVDKLYLLNTKISESLYLPLQTLEITLRNSIHKTLSEKLSPVWFDQPDSIKIPNQYEQIGEAKSSLIKNKKPVEPDRIVAELTFGFWSGLFQSNYDDLWKSYLHKIVIPDEKNGVTRKSFSSILTPLRKLRNRVAHHECIIEWNTHQSHTNIKTLLSWLSPQAKEWVENHSSFPSIYEEHKDTLYKVQKHKK